MTPMPGSNLTGSNMSQSAQSDATLVVAALGGDRAALGQIYDRYSNDIYSFAMSRLRNPDQAADATQETFVMVATRLSTLRHPERLRAWVFAIARNKIIDQVRYAERSHTEVTETMIISHDDHSADLESVESASLLWDAAGSLTERDRDLLELSIRHGLDGDDLADALGVAISHLHVLKSRMNDRLKKAVGSLLIARMGTEDCPDLAAILSDWDGMFTLDVRSRVTRHVSDCDICENKQAALIGRGMAFGMLPIIPAPPSLRGSTIDAMADALGGGASPTANAGSERDPFCSCAEKTCLAIQMIRMRPSAFSSTSLPTTSICAAGQCRPDLRCSAEGCLRFSDGRRALEGQVRQCQSPRVLRRGCAVVVRQQPRERSRPQSCEHARGAAGVRSSSRRDLPRGVRRNGAPLHQASHATQRAPGGLQPCRCAAVCVAPSTGRGERQNPSRRPTT